MPNFTEEWRVGWIRRESLEKKRARGSTIVKKLKRSYPGASIALRYANTMQLLVAVILSAQCTDKKVNEVTKALFKKYRTAKDFARADIKTLEKEIRQTGFYHAKARSIKESATMIVREFGGKVPGTMEEILQLRGVARKTANIVLGNAFGVVEGIAVDTHVGRLAQRLGLTAFYAPEKIEQDLMALLPHKEWLGFTYLLIEHGRAVCSSQRPACQKCILSSLCPSRRAVANSGKSHAT